MEDTKSTKSMNGALIYDVVPREMNGRDVIERFDAQFRPASLKCLEILETNNLTSVYCEYQDDYVTEYKCDDKIRYDFYQVKTNTQKSARWSFNDLFGFVSTKKHLNNSDNFDGNVTKFENSFIGRLIVHEVNFGSTTGTFNFETNICLNDEMATLESHFINGDLSTELPKYIISVILKFAEKGDFPIDNELHVKEVLSKLNFITSSSCLLEDNLDFALRARNKIVKFSEVELSRNEIQGISDNLITLVKNKSKKVLSTSITPEELDLNSRVTQRDVLDLLPISQYVYESFSNSGDQNALKSASIIQRLVKRNGFDEGAEKVIINSKLSWDNWLIGANRNIPEYKMNKLMANIKNIYRKLTVEELSFSDVFELVDALFEKLSKDSIYNELSDEIIFGGVFAVAVKEAS